RKDIAQVIYNCDIYLGTYPVAGGLMTQYAAMLGKPIIAYGSLSNVGNNIESLLLVNDIKLTHYSVDNFLNEFSCLVNDTAYRKKQSELLKSSVIQSIEFNQSLKTLINTNKITQSIKEINIDADYICDSYIDADNNFLHQYYSLLIKPYWIYKKYDKIFILKNIYLFYKSNRKNFMRKLKKHIWRSE
ncbi:MAG: hypothetical protein LBE13_04580, partial [Bacteroidales bacterium]|nr:hypothetical protein [Bacteroidales bacterium]